MTLALQKRLSANIAGSRPGIAQHSIA
jgi:hypothetical protein